MKNYSAALMTILLSLLLAACGGGEVSTEESPAPETAGSTINLFYSKGPVSNAEAILFDANGNQVAGPVETLDGQATFSNVTYLGMVYARFSGGSYTDEATGSYVVLPDSFQMRSGALDNTGSGSLQLIATPLTEMGFLRAEAAAGADLKLEDVNAHIDDIADDFGLDSIDLTTVSPTPLQDVSGNSASDRYGIVLTAITQQQFNAGAPPGSSSLQNYIDASASGVDQSAYATAVNDLASNISTSIWANSDVISTIVGNAGSSVGNSSSSSGSSSSGGNSSSSSGSSSSGGSNSSSSSSGGMVLKPLYDNTTALEPIVSFVRSDGVVVTRIADRGRDRHAKDIGMYDPNNILNSDHYDHYLAHYWEFRTARIQLEDHVPNGQSLIKATFVTEEQLGAREFRVWYWGATTTGQFHFNPQKEEEKVNPNETGVVYVGKGTWDENFVKISESGHQYMYTLDIVNKWENGGQFQLPLQVGTNMEFEVSQFLLSPPAGARLNYYGTSFVYVIGEPGVKPFEWDRNANNPGGSNDGTPLPAAALSGGGTTLGYNYSDEPAGRFMQMATNMSHSNAQPFVRGRRVHHTNFEDGVHDERNDNPVWTEQIGKAGNHYINHSCAACHVRNGRALVADVGGELEKWVFKVGDTSGNSDPLIGAVLQPSQTGAGASEGSVSLGAWSDAGNGLRSPNYVFGNGAPAQFSARIAPQLVGVGLLDAIPETTILDWADPDDENNDGISGRAAETLDPESGDWRLGRFGYKAAASSVRHQVAMALNTDIGVMTSMLPDPDCGSQQASCGSSGQELADDQFDDLVKYISLLGVGARRDYSNTAGETIFANLGCGGCHRDTMATSPYHPLAELRNQTIHPYTDLLLHDMGSGLADNLGEGVASGAEWRTAPLWGLGLARNVMLGDAKANDTVSLAGDPDDVNRIGYLHDGRARTIDEAIRWHGGEAFESKNAYEALSGAQRDRLLDFLNSL